MPLVAYPTSAPRDDENAQRLCMSGASSGLSILFFAMQASIVTSAMATAVEIPTKQSTAELTGNPIVIATIAAETVPSIPTVMKSKRGFISEAYSCCVPVGNLAVSHKKCLQLLQLLHIITPAVHVFG